MQTKNTEYVIDAVKSGFQSFYKLAYLNAWRGAWYKKLTRADQLQVGRAIFTLRDIAAAPERHFSRAATEGAWRGRAAEYARQKTVNPEWAAFYIVQTPADIVRDTVDAAFWEDYALRARFYNFCEYVKDWYYNSESADKKDSASVARDAEKIIAISKKTADDVIIAKDGRAVYYMTKFLEKPAVQRLLAVGGNVR